MRKDFWFLIALPLLCLTAAAAQGDPAWTEPFPPHRVIGNVYYVGSKGLASYLITTPQGHILINSSLETSVPLIKDSVEKLGFHFSDIKILLISHAHGDHCAGSARVKEMTGAKYYVMDADVPVVESGGRADFQYGDSSNAHFKPTKVDRVLHDGDEVRLGDTVLVAHLTPGHTRGTTTWTTKVSDGGKSYGVVIVGSPNVNPGYKLVGNTQYPQIAQDYERTFEVLKSLPCDVFLGAHGDYYGMDAKFARMKPGGANPFIDGEGYKSYVAEREQAFREELKRQSPRPQYFLDSRGCPVQAPLGRVFWCRRKRGTRRTLTAEANIPAQAELGRGTRSSLRILRKYRPVRAPDGILRLPINMPTISQGRLPGEDTSR